MLTQAQAAIVKAALVSLVDAVTDPVVVPVPPVPVPTHQPSPSPQLAAPDIMDLDVTSEAEVRSWIDIMSGDAQGSPNQISANRAGEFLVDTNTPTGKPINCLRAGGNPANSMRILNWYAQLGQPNTKLAGFAPVDELWCRSCYFLEPDVVTGCDPRSLGMKLSGLSMTYPGLWPAAIGEVGLTQVPGIADSVSFFGYGYWQEGPQLNQLTSARAPIAKWFTVETHVKMNTLGQKDGVLEHYLDDVLVYTRNDVDFRGGNGAAHWGCMQVQVYVGGSQYLFLGDVHVRIAKIAIASHRIGVPAELQTTPTTPAPLPIPKPVPPATGGFTPIAGTAQLSGVLTQIADQNIGGAFSTTGIINAWNGLAATDDSLVSLAAGGHGIAANAALAVKLGVAAPRWTVLDPGSEPAALDPTSSYMKDGKGVSRHTYNSTVFVAHRPDGVPRVLNLGVDAPMQLDQPGAAWNPNAVTGFRLDTNSYEPAGTYPDAPFSSDTHAMAVCRDPRTSDVYIAAQDKWARWHCATNAWEIVGGLIYTANGNSTPLDSWEHHPTLIDAKRNRWVHLCEGRNGNPARLQWLDLATWVSTVIPIAGFDLDSDTSAVHDLDHDLYCFVSGGALWAIDPDSAALTRLCDAPAPVNGVQNRLAYFQTLGGIAYLPGFDSDVLWMPTR